MAQKFDQKENPDRLSHDVQSKREGHPTEGIKDMTNKAIRKLVTFTQPIVAAITQRNKPQFSNDPFAILEARLKEQRTKLAEDQSLYANSLQEREGFLSEYRSNFKLTHNQNRGMIQREVEGFANIIWGEGRYVIHENTKTSGADELLKTANALGGRLEGWLARRGRWFVRGDKLIHPWIYAIEMEPDDHGIVTWYRVGKLHVKFLPNGTSDYTIYYQHVPAGYRDASLRIRNALVQAHEWKERDFPAKCLFYQNSATLDFAFEYIWVKEEKKNKDGIPTKRWSYQRLQDRQEYRKNQVGLWALANYDGTLKPEEEVTDASN